MCTVHETFCKCVDLYNVAEQRGMCQSMDDVYKKCMNVEEEG